VAACRALAGAVVEPVADREVMRVLLLASEAAEVAVVPPAGSGQLAHQLPVTLACFTWAYKEV